MACRVPEECPKVIADLCMACTSTSAKKRPSAQEAMNIIEESFLAIPGTSVGASAVAIPAADLPATNLNTHEPATL